MRTTLAIIFMTFATQASAKDEPLTIEERLPNCIVEATELINRGTSIKSALEASGKPAEHDDVLLVMYAEKYFQLYQNAIKKSVDEGELASEIEPRLLSTGEPLYRKTVLVESMLKEHWKDEAAIAAQAEFIAACANNFDGVVETQADTIKNLEDKLDSAEMRIDNLQEKYQDYDAQRLRLIEKVRQVADLKTQIRDYKYNEKRLQNHSSMLESQLKQSTQNLESQLKQSEQNEAIIRDFEDTVALLQKDIENRKMRFVDLFNKNKSLKDSLYNFIALSEKANWLISISVSSPADRNNKIAKSSLRVINYNDFPELVRCRNVLRDKGELNDRCAFKLSGYLMETDLQLR